MNYTIEQTRDFAAWLTNLRDLRARIAIGRRIERLVLGNLGDSKSLGEGIHELRIDVSGGYRVYFTNRHNGLVLLLAGGEKSSQTGDIARARSLAKELK